MRKIDKTQILSTEYKKWEEDFEKNNLPHEKYKASHKYYKDVVMNLLFCQKGLCAYTEVQLCSQEAIEKSKWVDGKYQFEIKVNDGDLEHFDESLKSKSNDEIGIKDWLWSNLFMVDTNRNRNKGTKEVDEILKPDFESYNEFELFDYNTDTHFFVANFSLPTDIRIRIKKMIDVLGINFPNLVDKRKNTIIKSYEFGILDNEFPTAQNFYKKKLNNKN